MQNHVKYLVVENEPDWSAAITEGVKSFFLEKRRFTKARVKNFTAYDAKQASPLIEQGGWDLVMLDLNLAEKGGKSRISGLDLLGEIAKENRAYFVIIITGAVTDSTLEKFYGKDAAALLRFGALNEAVRMLPASRVRILHKPTAANVKTAFNELRPHLESALDQYCAVSLERNIFRPLPGDTKLWEVCFNGGTRLTLKHEEPFKMIRSALAQPNRELKVIQLVQALAQSSGMTGAIRQEEPAPEASKRDSTELEDKSTLESVTDGIDWSEMEGYGTISGTPVATNEGAISIETLIGGLLLAQQQNSDLGQTIDKLRSIFGEEVLLSLPAKADTWAAKGQQACAQFGVDDAPAELRELARSLRSLLAPIRDRWVKERALSSASTQVATDKRRASGRIRVAKGTDTPELVLARQHWKRFKTTIKKHPSLVDFLDHMIQWVDRSPTAKGHLFYRPPGGGELCPFWLTE
jgi:hypothetical protein